MIKEEIHKHENKITKQMTIEQGREERRIFWNKIYINDMKMT